jgi:hypothetical protein
MVRVLATLKIVVLVQMLVLALQVLFPRRRGRVDQKLLLLMMR